nr:hypothetical protein BaRGS_030860 [Batillaria attramentaria]
MHKQLPGQWGVLYDSNEKDKLPRIELFEEKTDSKPVKVIILERLKWVDKSYKHTEHPTFEISIKREKHHFSKRANSAANTPQSTGSGDTFWPDQARGGSEVDEDEAPLAGKEKKKSDKESKESKKKREKELKAAEAKAKKEKERELKEQKEREKKMKKEKEPEYEDTSIVTPTPAPRKLPPSRVVRDEYEEPDIKEEKLKPLDIEVGDGDYADVQ